MKKIVQKLLILALFFIPFVSSAQFYTSSTSVTSNSATLSGSLEQIIDEDRNYNSAVADFKISDKYATDCSKIEPLSNLPFSIFVPEPSGIFDSQGNNIAQPGQVVQSEVSKDITGLNPGTTYYFCLYGKEFVNPLDILYSQVSSFKTAPKVTLTASPNPTPSGGNTVLTWVTEGAVSCSATGGSGGWAGSKNKDGGSQNINDIRVRTTFTLTCTNGFNYGNTIANVTVTISQTAQTTNIGQVITVPLPGATNTGGQIIEPEKVLEVTDVSALLQGKIFNSANLGDPNVKKYGYFRISKVGVPPIF